MEQRQISSMEHSLRLCKGSLLLRTMSLQPCVIHPCEGPAVLLANAFHPVRLLPLFTVRQHLLLRLARSGAKTFRISPTSAASQPPMALVRYETIHMLSQIDLTMKLCFLAPQNPTFVQRVAANTRAA